MEYCRSLCASILGDIAGSIREGVTTSGDYPSTIITGNRFRSPRGKDTEQRVQHLELFQTTCRPTDDTVLSLAVAEHLMNNDSIDNCLRSWYSTYPNAGFGRGFAKWATETNAPQGNSWGNGACMRVAAIADFSNSPTQALELAKATAQPTHNDPTAIYGAQVIALSGYLVKKGANQETLIQSLNKELRGFDYNVSSSLDDMRPLLKWSLKAAETVPIALRVFLESKNLEDLYRKAISMGHDVDTIAAMAGTIGGHLWPLENYQLEVLQQLLDQKMRTSLYEFEVFLSKQ